MIPCGVGDWLFFRYGRGDIDGMVAGFSKKLVQWRAFLDDLAAEQAERAEAGRIAKTVERGGGTGPAVVGGADAAAEAAAAVAAQAASVAGTATAAAVAAATTEAAAAGGGPRAFSAFTCLGPPCRFARPPQLDEAALPQPHWPLVALDRYREAFQPPGGPSGTLEAGGSSSGSTSGTSSISVSDGGSGGGDRDSGRSSDVDRDRGGGGSGGGRVVVFGTMEPWAESLCLALGAANVTTVEYMRCFCALVFGVWRYELILRADRGLQP